jgi:general secretion pathway protein A
MYEVFYRLKEKPFSLLPDPSYLYLSEKHQMALTLLEYSLLNQAGFCVISGVTGAGKTTLIRHLLNQFGNDVAVGLITNTHQSFSDLLRWILMAFSLDYNSDSKPQLYQTFVNFLIEQYAKNRNTVLIVDEAQNMSVETLEELRMLSNINADKDQVLQIILVGQPGLRDKLSRPDLEQFAQRIAVDYHIEPLNAEETRNYIRHRLTIAGGDPELFENDAAQSVYRYSSGIPRLINLLCENALVYGYAENVSRISARLVDDVAHERQLHGLLPRMQSESVHAISHQTNTPREMGEAAKTPYFPSPDMTPTTSPLPAEDEALAETLLNAGRASATSGDSARNKNEARQTTEAQQQGSCGEAAEAAMHAVMAQGAGMREQRAGSISKLVHLDTWPRSATDSGHGNRPVTRAEVRPQASSVITDGLQKPEPTQAAEGKGDGAEFPQDVVTLPPDSAQGAPGEATVDNEAEGPIAAAVQEDRDMTYDNNNSKNGTTGIGTGGKWVVATALGFSGGLLVALVLFVTTYFKTAGNIPATPTPAAVLSPSATAATGPSVFVPAAAAENTAPVDQAMLKALERERDAAIAQTRALERERDAALAAAKAREREKAATLAAIKEQERAAALAAANMQLRTPPVEPKPVPQVEAVVPVPATKAVETAVRVESKPAAAETPAKFSANPCMGPSAKFLSTCKE